MTDLEAEGLAYLILLVGGIVWGIKMSPQWEKVKAFTKLRNKYYLHANRFETDLGWDSKDNAVHLTQAAEFLKSLQSERVPLEDRYIEPHL